MKFVLDESDQKCIDNINKDLEERGLDVPLFIHRVGQQYYINFTCLDIAKANNFIYELCTHDPKKRKEIEDIAGISINSINFCHGDNKIYELKEYLEDFLKKLDTI